MTRLYRGDCAALFVHQPCILQTFKTLAYEQCNIGVKERSNSCRLSKSPLCTCYVKDSLATLSTAPRNAPQSSHLQR